MIYYNGNLSFGVFLGFILMTRVERVNFLGDLMRKLKKQTGLQAAYYSQTYKIVPISCTIPLKCI